jgi:zinc protease
VKSLNRFLIPALLCVLALAAAVSAQTPPLPPGIERVAAVEGITEYRLGNGFRALVFPDPSKPTITVNITYLVGSRQENYGETGMAHMIEHLVSYGSPKHPDAKQEQQERGARRNATTSYDRTNYYEIFPASDANLDWALDLEADRMVNAFVKKDILDSQMTVVRNEMEAGENSPQNILVQRMLSTAYLWHNYGRTVIGARSDVENVPIERLLAFYKTYYRPDNAVLVIAGKFEEPKAIKLLAEKFGPIPRPAVPIPQTYTIEPVQDGERAVTLRRMGDVQQVGVAYHIPAGSHADLASLDLLAHVLANAPSGRLYKALVEPKKAASVFGFNFRLRDPGLAFFMAAVRKEGSLEDARKVLLDTLDTLDSHPVTKEEVERARLALVRQIELGLTDSERVGLILSEAAATGDWRLLFLQRDIVRKATVEDVQRVATTYLKPSNRTIGAFIPESNPARAEIPKPPDVATLVKDYKGDQNLAVGEAFDPAPANIDKRTIRGQIGSGLKLAMLPKKTRGSTVQLVMRIYYGDEKSLSEKAQIADLTRSMLNRGTTRRTRQQIQDEVNRLKARPNIGGAGNYTELSVETVRASLPELLALAAEMLREPSFPENEFEQLKQERLASYESARSEPQAIGSIAFMRHMSAYPQGDPRYVPTFDERIAQTKTVTLDQVKQFWRNFYGASQGELAIVGDFDPEEIQQTVSRLFGSWKSPASFSKLRNPYRKITPLNQSLETPDKANGVIVGGMAFQINDQDADYPSLLLANYMLGGHSSSRFYSRIRAKEGLSYGVGSIVQAPADDRNSLFQMFAIAAPQNVPKVEKAFIEEIQRALKEGFAADEVAKAKVGWAQSQQVSRSNDNELVRRLRSHRYNDRTMAFDAVVEEKVQALTPDEIVGALRRHLDLAQITFVKAGDFKKATATQ